MPYQLKNTRVPGPGDLWRHIASDATLLVLTSDGVGAQCAIMNGPKVGPLRVEVPVKKMKSYGNRGFEFLRKRKGKTPKVAEDAGFYDPRIKNLGAI